MSDDSPYYSETNDKLGKHYVITIGKKEILDRNDTSGLVLKLSEESQLVDYVKKLKATQKYYATELKKKERELIDAHHLIKKLKKR